MKKYIVLSVNDNVDYLFFTPLTCWAWRKFGWEPVVFYNRSRPEQPIEQLVFNQNKEGEMIFMVDPIEGYRSDTITQVSRLYAGCVVNDPESYLMTGDIDMIPLSDYWKPDTSNITVYGHDLTGFGHYPICYIGMPASLWRFVMGIHDGDTIEGKMKLHLDGLPQAKDPDFYKYWFTDQDLITARLNDYGKEKITFVNRGAGHCGYARGRVDRGSGGWVLDQPELIDAHLMQQTHHSQDKIDKLMQLLRHVWPGEDFTWFEKYTEEFKRLAV